MSYHLAQLNIAQMLAPVDSPQLAEFAANLDRVNALAESTPGFVWQDVDSLREFVFSSDHMEIMRRRSRGGEHRVERAQQQQRHRHIEYSQS